MREAGQMPTPPPNRSARNASPPTDDFNRPIPTAVAMLVSASGGRRWPCRGRPILRPGRLLSVASRRSGGNQVDPRGRSSQRRALR
ncbi:hypothetical protein ACSQ67_014466 [Phaseolus vulgaris]